MAKGEIIKAFHIDCGRKYFTVAQIKEMIDTMAVNDYNTLELAIGNDGHRLLLNDMTLQFGGREYSSDKVKQAINEGNKIYYDAGEFNEWNEDEINEIILYAKSKNIEIVPLVNSPGHMDSILHACTTLTGIDCSYNKSKRTIDVTNGIALEFTVTFVNKFVEFFKEKGCKYFNLGGDEFANDIYTKGSMGFGHLIDEGQYGFYVFYVNRVASKIKASGLIPIAFNDGFYFRGNVTAGTFDKEILISYWSAGWGDYKVYPATGLVEKGHKIFNTNGNWYYVLNWAAITGGKSTFEKTLNGIKNNPYDKVVGSDVKEVEGCMVCYWCDQPKYDYDSKENGYLLTQINEFAKANPSIFHITANKLKTKGKNEKFRTLKHKVNTKPRPNGRDKRKHLKKGKKKNKK